MRAMMFAVGLGLASTTAIAQDQTFSPAPADHHVTLTNGCVYAQNLLRDDNAWSLIYTQAGTTVQCPLTIYGMTADTPAPAPAPAYAVAPVADVPVDVVAEALIAPEPTPVVTRSASAYTSRRALSFLPQYMVGVFR